MSLSGLLNRWEKGFNFINRFTNDEIELTLKTVPMDSAGFIDYAKFAHIIKHGTEDEVQS